METRKIQSVGGGTYTVSIPKDWAEAQGITTGDRVGLHRHIDGILAIQAPECESSDPSRITVHLGETETNAIEHVLRAAYAVGTKEVRLVNSETFTVEQQRVIDRVARNLTGVSVVEDSETEIRVKTLLDTDEVSVTQTVRQLRFVVLSMHRDATAALTRETDPDQFAERDNQADRLHAMISRSFARGIRRLEEVDALGVPRSELFDLWATTRELERVGDHAGGIGAVSQSLDSTVDQTLIAETRDIADGAREVVADAVSVVIDDAGVETVQEVLAARDQIRDAVSAFDRRFSVGSADQLRLDPVLHRLRRTAEHGGNIAEIGLQQAIRSGELTATETGEPPSRNPSP